MLLKYSLLTRSDPFGAVTKPSVKPVLPKKWVIEHERGHAEDFIKIFETVKQEIADKFIGKSGVTSKAVKIYVDNLIDQKIKELKTGTLSNTRSINAVTNTGLFDVWGKGEDKSISSWRVKTK